MTLNGPMVGTLETWILEPLEWLASKRHFLLGKRKWTIKDLWLSREWLPSLQKQSTQLENKSLTPVSIPHAAQSPAWGRCLLSTASFSTAWDGLDCRNLKGSLGKSSLGKSLWALLTVCLLEVAIPASRAKLWPTSWSHYTLACSATLFISHPGYWVAREEKLEKSPLYVTIMAVSPRKPRVTC